MLIHPHDNKIQGNAEISHDESLTKDTTGLLEDARNATVTEHSLTSFEAIRLYWKAVLWSVVVSIGIIMDGYDQSLIGTFYAMPAFQARFGQPYSGGYQVTASWQTRLSVSTSVGNIIGVFLNSYFTERIGHKRVLLINCIFSTAAVFILFFAPNIGALVAGEVLIGMAIGVFSTMAVGYASEICPVVLRGYLEVYVMLCWSMGGLVAAGILKGFSSNTTQWAYKVPFAIQWVWPALLFPLMLFGPDSPWWLVRMGRIEDAERTMRRLISKNTDRVNVKEVVAMMTHTTALEREICSGTSYLDCFRGTDRRRTEIVLFAYSMQSLVGYVLPSYFTYFFEQAGLSTSKAFDMGVGQQCLGLFFTSLAFYVSGMLGRRIILVTGLASMTTIMFIIGFVALASNDNAAIAWAQSVLCLVWWSIFSVSMAPMTYVIIGETSATRLRQKTIGMGRIVYNICVIIGGIIAPYILNPTAGNWKGKAAFVPAILTLICTVWAFFRGNVIFFLLEV